MSEEHFKRMTLLEEAEYDRLRQKQIRDYNPTLKSLADIQSAIDQLMDHPILQADEKLQILNNLNAKFDSLYNLAKNSGMRSTPSTVAVISNHQAAEERSAAAGIYKQQPDQ